MKKQNYIAPTIRIVPIDSATLICTSYGESPVGGTAPEFDATASRSNLWDED